MTPQDPSGHHSGIETALSREARGERRAKALSGAQTRAIPERLSTEHLRQLYAICRVLNSSDDTESALREVLAVLDQTLPIQSAMLMVRDRQPICIACMPLDSALRPSLAVVKTRGSAHSFRTAHYSMGTGGLRIDDAADSGLDPSSGGGQRAVDGARPRHPRRGA